jgi:CBS domain-containing protein
VQRRIVPHVVTGEQELAVLPRAASVAEAAKLMHRRQISAVMIVEEDQLLGIFTERDLSRCIAMCLELPSIPLGLVMTRRPKTIRPDETTMQALTRMQEGNFRHLPVVDGTTVIGIVSSRDVLATVRRELEQDIRTRQSFVKTESYEMVHAV